MKEIKSEKITLPVEGMTCASCVSRVEKTISKIEGIKNINVNLATEKVTFEYDPEKIDLNLVAQKVDDAGYKLDLSVTNSKKAVPGPQEDKQNVFLTELKKDFLLALILTVPILIVNMGIMWDGFFLKKYFSVDQINRLLLILTTPIVFVSGKRFFRIFWNNLKHFTADMNSLVAIGTGSAYLYSLIISLFPEWFNHKNLHVYFDTTAVIITLILLGRWLENRAKAKTGSAIKKLIELQPKSAIVKIDGKEIEKKLDDLETGDVVIIKPGNKIPADGIVVYGTSSINEAMITGESIPVEKMIGSKVIGGTVNLNGYLEFEVKTVGENTVLGQIIKLVEDAQSSKAPVQNLADKIASVFVPVVVIISIITFIIWLLISPDNFSHALTNFIAVLIIACPCALGLATPTALIVGMGKAAQNGILFKSGESLEKVQEANTIIFDKTGTITEGILSVNKVKTFQTTQERFISILASIESKSEHPIAKAIVNYANAQNIQLQEVYDFQAIPGKGIIGFINNKKVIAGNATLLEDNGISPESIKQIKNGDEIDGSIIYLSYDNILLGYITISDTVKGNASEIISAIKKMRINTVLLSGDNFQSTKSVAEKIGIENFEAGVLPWNKSDVVTKYKGMGKKVIMVGDGINDAPALANSDVGIAIGTGTDVAIESAGVVLINGDLNGVVNAILLSKQTIRTVKQNLFWAFFYNVIGIPLAALGLLNPMFAALAMSFSSVSVVSNSLRLRAKNKTGLSPV